MAAYAQCRQYDMYYQDLAAKGIGWGIGTHRVRQTLGEAEMPRAIPKSQILRSQVEVSSRLPEVVNRAYHRIASTNQHPTHMDKKWSISDGVSGWYRAERWVKLVKNDEKVAGYTRLDVAV